MRRYGVILLFFLSCNPGWTRADRCPDWTNYGNKDPRGVYIFGVGSGERPQEAADNARAEIARYFKVTLSRQTIVESSYKEKNNQSDTYSSGSDTLHSRVSRVLEGAAILKRAFCQNQHWALAGLDVQAMAARLNHRIDVNIQSLRNILKILDNSEPSLHTLRLLNQAHNLIFTINDTLKDLAALGETRKGITPLEARLNRYQWIRDKVLFAVNGPKWAKNLVVQNLVRHGIHVVTGDTQTPPLVEVTVKYHRFPIKRLPAEFFWARLRFYMKVKDLSTGVLVYEAGPLTMDASAMSGPDAITRADYLFKAKILPKAMKDMYNSLWNLGKVQ